MVQRQHHLLGSDDPTISWNSDRPSIFWRRAIFSLRTLDGEPACLAKLGSIELAEAISYVGGLLNSLDHELCFLEVNRVTGTEPKHRLCQRRFAGDSKYFRTLEGERLRGNSQKQVPPIHRD